ncbi:Mediator of RNA polymerase II transcription subunit 31 [Rhinocladiella similis]
MEPTTPPTTLSHRFTLELEFVLCLSNPLYLQYLAVNHPHLLNKPAASHNNADLENSDAARFARYLKYLSEYWRKPEYAKYLTHPGATLRNLDLLQQEQFRKDIIRPDVIAKLFETEVGQPAVQSEIENPASQNHPAESVRSGA